MITFSTILFPTDFSDAARPALRYAQALCGWYNALLHVLHVANAPGDAPVAPSPVGGIPMGMTGEAVEHLLAEARAWVGDGLSGIMPHYCIEYGVPATMIAEHARKIGADLIIMGSHGRSGFSRLFQGSVTEKVLVQAPCAVLTVPPHLEDTATPRVLFRRILCGVDFSPSSKRALDFALDLARQADGTVTVLHSVEWFTEGGPAVRGQFDIEGFRRSLIADARERLASTLSSEARTWVQIKETVEVGRPHRRILEHADLDGIELIVLGAQGNEGLDLAIFGSTTHQVLRAARCPVLVAQEA